MATITELKAAINERAIDLSNKGYLSLRKFNAVTAYRSNWKKQDYEVTLAYLNNDVFTALLASHVDQVTPVNTPITVTQEYSKPSIIDAINYITYHNGKIALVTDSTIKYYHESNEYNLQITDTHLLVSANKPIEYSNKHYKLDIFSKPTDEYRAPSNLDYLDEIEKHNEKILNQFVPSGKLADDNKREIKKFSYTAANKFKNSKVAAYEDLKSKQPGMTTGQDLKFWLNKIYLEWYSKDQIAAIQGYFTHYRDSISDEFRTYCNQYGHTITEFVDGYSMTSYEVEYNFSAVGKLSFSEFLKFTNQELFLDPYIGLVNKQRCPKLIGLCILTGKDITNIQPHLSILTGIVKLDLKNVLPMINISGSEYRVSDQYFIQHENTSYVDLAKTVQSRVIGQSTRKSSLNRQRHYDGAGKDKSPYQFKLSKELIHKPGSSYNGAYLVYEPIEKSFVLDDKKRLVLPDTIKQFIKEKGVTVTKNVLGKILVQRSDIQIILGLLVIKHGKLWYYNLPQAYAKQYFFTQGKVTKQVETFEVNYKPTDTDRRRSLEQTITKVTKEIEVNNNVYSSVPRLETHYQHIDPEILNIMSMHGLNDNRPIVPSKIAVEWQLLLNIPLTCDSYLIGKNCPYRITK